MPRQTGREQHAGRAAAALLSAGLETGLGVCALLLPPLLALTPRGAAALAAIAGLGAAGLVLMRPPWRDAALRWPASLLVALLLWGALSAAWSIGPGRSLILDARLAGLFAAGLALSMAARRIAAPWRLSVFFLAGTGLAVALALYDLASGGGLSRYVTVRGFAAPRLNQIAAWLAMLAAPGTALLLGRGRRLLALAAGLVMAATVVVLAGTAAKVALALSLAVMALICLRRGAVTRVAAALSIVFILTAPLTLPRLAQLPRVYAAVDAFKESAGHRLLIWSFVGDRIAERPFAGWGLDAARAIPGGKLEIRPGERWLPLHPHNAALQLWLELGAPGAALLALFVGWLWLRLAAVAWPPLYAAAAGGSLAAALAVGDASWGVWQEWWIGTLGLALFAILTMARAAASPADPTPPPQRDWRGADR